MRRRAVHAEVFASFAPACGFALAAETTVQPARFEVEAELRPLAMSACARFALDASARVAPEAKSADGRFALKVVRVPSVGCDPFPDPLFGDGFEVP